MPGFRTDIGFSEPHTSDPMGRTIHHITLNRENPQQKWGFGITGGKDVALTFRIEKVKLASPSGEAGLKNLDYLIKVNGKEVFEMGHNELVEFIKSAGGSTLELEVERWGWWTLLRYRMSGTI